MNNSTLDKSTHTQQKTWTTENKKNSTKRQLNTCSPQHLTTQHMGTITVDNSTYEHLTLVLSTHRQLNTWTTQHVATQQVDNSTLGFVCVDFLKNRYLKFDFC